MGVFLFSADKGHKPANNPKVMGSRPVESHSSLFVNECMMNDAIHRKRYALNGIFAVDYFTRLEYYIYFQKDLVID